MTTTRNANLSLHPDDMMKVIDACEVENLPIQGAVLGFSDCGRVSTLGCSGKEMRLRVESAHTFGATIGNPLALVTLFLDQADAQRIVETLGPDYTFSTERNINARIIKQIERDAADRLL